MDPEQADQVVDRHHQMVVNSIEAGAVDGDLQAIKAAERRRSPPREPVLRAIRKRRDVIEHTSEDATDG